jgi:hypothetical protein
MIQNLVTYLGIGTILMAIVDFTTIIFLKDSGITFSNKERIIAIIFWPVLVSGIMVGRFKQK